MWLLIVTAINCNKISWQPMRSHRKTYFRNYTYNIYIYIYYILFLLYFLEVSEARGVKKTNCDALIIFIECRLSQLVRFIDPCINECPFAKGYAVGSQIKFNRVLLNVLSLAISLITGTLRLCPSRLSIVR